MVIFSDSLDVSKSRLLLSYGVRKEAVSQIDRSWMVAQIRFYRYGILFLVSLSRIQSANRADHLRILRRSSRFQRRDSGADHGLGLSVFQYVPTHVRPGHYRPRRPFGPPDSKRPNEFPNQRSADRLVMPIGLEFGLARPISRAAEAMRPIHSRAPIPPPAVAIVEFQLRNGLCQFPARPRRRGVRYGGVFRIDMTPPDVILLSKMFAPISHRHAVPRARAIR